jgi:hypothetical protein
MSRLADSALALGSIDADKAAYAALRSGGARLADAWSRAATPSACAVDAIERVGSDLSPDQVQSVDTIELCLAHSFRDLRLPADRSRITNVHRGVRGLELRHENREDLYGPTEMLARNLSFERVLESFGQAHGLDDRSLARDVRIRTFDAEQFLLPLAREPIRMTRGARLVRQEDVTRAGVQAFGDRLRAWIAQHVHASGRMTYKYWPSRGQESPANNMLRQWMATLCLGRLAAESNATDLRALASRNLEHNVSTSFRFHAGLGLIECDGKVKLGAVALAALAIFHHPERDRYLEEERSLHRMVDHLWNEDGSFRTFYRPADRNDNQNFYPGEALLLWATLYSATGERELLERLLKSFRYYRQWHLSNRNPAFVPWHTQAYCLLWRTTREPELRDFVFAINDWLLDMQQWDDAAYPDVKGQFYNPRRPDFGPPHASSTGVYLEGLADAYALARDCEDNARQEAYRLAIIRGLRSVMQLQFSDDVDMYYIAKRHLALGGLRTTVYDNAIRVDNVQHNLMAVMKVLGTFREDDYA